jgi:hypothetical protein
MESLPLSTMPLCNIIGTAKETTRIYFSLGILWDFKIRKLAIVSPLLGVEKIKENNESGIGQ